MFRVFPVDPSSKPTFAQNFGAHRGVDIFAPKGALVLAVDDGEVRADTDPKGGNVLYLRATDATVYYYAHLSGYVGGFPRTVSKGDPIGRVGDTGNAAGKGAHLHIEVHPNGGAQSVDPFPLLMPVAPSGSMRLPVPVAPLPPNPLGQPEKKKRAAEPPGLWFWAWGLLLRSHTRSHARREAQQPMGDA
jgi:murein DD-endopeptidase MepM/ murein hydrolase activator NlpD